MLNPGGQATYHAPDGTVVEQDTYTCAHCNRIILLKPAQSPYGGCRQCGGMICSTCVGDVVCKPWERRMEETEARFAMRRSAGLI
jgi:hypothetical protein